MHDLHSGGVLGVPEERSIFRRRHCLSSRRRKIARCPHGPRTLARHLQGDTGVTGRGFKGFAKRDVESIYQYVTQLLLCDSFLVWIKLYDLHKPYVLYKKKRINIRYNRATMRRWSVVKIRRLYLIFTFLNAVISNGTFGAFRTRKHREGPETPPCITRNSIIWHNTVDKYMVMWPTQMFLLDGVMFQSVPLKSLRSVYFY